MECCVDADYRQLANSLYALPEEVYEASDDDRFFMADTTASVVLKEQLVKYRKIDRSIICMLKEFYGYRDQISGEKIGERYGESVVEAHHIDYFTRSQNNDSTNIIIISPNYHRIIHKNNPYFNRKKFQFEFANGEVLRLQLYEHLKI
jgi:predicted HNH restriction endonuclease